MLRVRHLYLKIYVAFIAILVGTLVAAAIVRVSVERDLEKYPQVAQGFAELLVEQLPKEQGPELDRALEHAASRLGVELVLTANDGTLVGQSAHADEVVEQGKRYFGHRGPPTVVVSLSDGRQLRALFRHSPAHGRFFLWLAFFAAVLAPGCYPLARGITRRLERLRTVAGAWGDGALTARAPIDGHDEIAALSHAFNLAAERVQSLVAQQKRVLASASHELRSPLARMQMALALVDQATAERRSTLLAEFEREVAELNRLIEDLLITAKAEHAPLRTLVALDALIVAECRRSNITNVHTQTVTVRGNELSLRSLVRNLLENAERHGGVGTIEVSLKASGEQCEVCVFDRGPGIPAAEAERIFEAFYRPPSHDEGRHGGVGLGLFLVRQIAEAHGGKAKYTPREEGGSCFTVTLPIGA